MKKSFLRSPWLLVTVMVMVAALSATLWIGCGEKQESALNPVEQVQPSFTKMSLDDPAVQTVTAVQNRHTASLMSDPNVVGTGTGLTPDGKLAVLVLLKNSTTSKGRSALLAIPNEINGVPTRTIVVGEVRAMGNTGTYRPVPGGVSVGNDKECASGTIGCIVTKGGVRYALSNNHVLARENAAALGERIDQPGRYDGKPKCSQTGQIATLSQFKSIVFSTSANNEIDAAIAQFTTSSLCSMLGGTYTPSSTTVAPSLGLAVKKTGRTSGLTRGSISGINVTLNVGYSAGTARFVNQIMVNGNFIRSGDSGSLMVTDNASANPVGLCFAGGGGASFANPIGPVLSFFNATVCNTP